MYMGNKGVKCDHNICFIQVFEYKTHVHVCSEVSIYRLHTCTLSEIHKFCLYQEIEKIFKKNENSLKIHSD